MRRLYYGSTDLPLCEQGLAELAQLKEAGLYPGPEGLRLYTSGMLRTEQTLTALYGDLPRRVVADLREFCFGHFEMRGYEELKDLADFQRYAADQTLDRQPPGGERRGDFQSRVSRGLAFLLQDGEGDALAVSHGGVIGYLLETLFPEAGKNFYQWLPKPGHGFSLEFQGQTPKAWRQF